MTLDRSGITPGARVISDTRVLRGLRARRRGQAGLGISVLTILLTAVIAWRADRLFHQLLSTNLEPTTFVPADRPG